MIRGSRFAHMAGPFVRQFGVNADVDTTSDPEDLWEVGGVYAFPAVAATTTVLSSSTDDDGAPVGTGARTVEVVGLATLTGPEITQVITMDGTSTVELGTDLIRVNRVRVITVGSGGVNAGVINVRHGATNLSQISAGQGQSAQAIYTVPGLAAGRRASLKPYLTHVEACVAIAPSAGQAATDAAVVSLFLRAVNESWRRPYLFGLSVLGSSLSEMALEMAPELLAPGTDVRLEGTVVTADNTGLIGQFIINWLP